MSDRLDLAVAALVDALRAEVADTVEPTGPARLLSVDEAADALGVGRSTTYGLIQSGDLASIKVGRRRLVAAAAVADYIATTRD